MRDSWSELPLSSVAMRVTAKNKNLIDNVFTVSAEHGLIEQEKFFNKRVASKNLLGYTVVQPGMLVYNKSYSSSAPFGVITRNHHDFSGVVSPLYIVFEPKEDKVLGNYLELATNSLLFFSSLQKFIKEGGRAHGGITVSLSDFFDCAIPIPSLTEQKRIVDVLSSVDAYIDALQQQADTAHLARNAVFHELLSAGGHDWTETTISEVLMVSIGGIWGGDVGTDELDVRVYRQTEFNDNGHLSVPSDAIRSISLNQLKSRRIQPGDILLQKSAGTPTLPGRVVRVPEGIENDATCSNFLQLIRVDPKKCDPEFLFWELWIRHKSGGAFEFQRGTNIRNLDLNQYFAQSLRLPSFAEQRRIVEIVSSMDDVIQATEKAIAKAKNMRSGLLSDLLSGEHEIPASYDSLLGAA